MTANEPPSRWLAIGPGLVALAMVFTDATSQAHRVAIRADGRQRDARSGDPAAEATVIGCLIEALIEGLCWLASQVGARRYP